MAKDSPVGMIIGIGIAAAAIYALYEWLQNSACVSGGSLQNASPPLNWLCALPGLTPATSAPSSVIAAPATVAPAAAVTQTTAKLTNLTAPGQPYAVGDSFQLVITGPPNSPVTGSASQNGAVSSSTNFGTTNAAGQMVITGTWGNSDAGTWLQAWQVGSSVPAAVNFTISGGSAPSPSNGTCPSGYVYTMATTGGFNPVPTGSPFCSPISGVSGLGYINRIPRGLIHRGKIARG